MGFLDDVVDTVKKGASAVSNGVNNVGSQYVSAYSNGINNVGTQVGRRLGLGGSGNDLGQGLGMIPESGQASQLFSGMNTPPKTQTPQEQLLASQQQQLGEFKQGMPQMQKQMQDQLKSQFNSQLQGNLATVKNQNQQRGMAYGGMNQGQQMQETGREQGNLAQGLMGVNTGLDSAYQTMQGQALSTGTGIQNTNQQIQNSLYQQQLGQMQTSNQMAGSAMGLIANLGLLAALA